MSGSSLYASAIRLGDGVIRSECRSDSLGQRSAAGGRRDSLAALAFRAAERYDSMLSEERLHPPGERS